MSYRTGYRPNPYAALPAIPEAGVLTRYVETLAVIVPVARTNLVTNPSLETGTSGWTAVGGSVARTTDQQYHGAYSLAVTPTAGTTDGVYFGTVSLVSGTTYAVSAKVLGRPGVPYRIGVFTTGGAELVSKTFRGTGRWQWVWVFWTETSSTTRRIYVSKNGSASTGLFYVDGLQVEACAAGEVFPTTYIDGDQRGLVANQYPPAYLWSGTPHASTSSRSGQTRAGGRVMRFRDFGYLVTALVGLGLPVPQVDALPFAQLDGAQYLDTVKPPRSVSVVGRFDAVTPRTMAVQQAQLAARLDRDLVGLRQPLVLALQAQECGVAEGEPVTIQAAYAGGLEGNAVDLPSAALPITFTQHLPWVVGRDGGAALTVQQSVANAAYIITRGANGAYSALGTGMNATVTAIARGLDGTIYIGGSFTTASGATANNIVAWNPTTGAFSNVGSATALNGLVRALAVGPDGVLYVGGDFTNAGGDANADGIATWNGSVWGSLSTGTAGQVYALAVAPNGTLYAGGNFTSIGLSGADYIASWNGSAWADLGGVTAIGNIVRAIAIGPNGTVYAGGSFSNAGGVADADFMAAWDGSAWAALGSVVFDAAVRAIVIGPDGTVYAGGDFTAPATRIAAWNGSYWRELGTGLGPALSSVQDLAVAGDGTLHAGGTFTTANGITLPDSYARWNGASWLLGDVDLPGTASISALLVTPANELYLGYNTTGTATAAALTTVTNGGTAATYPRLTIKGPSSGTARIYQIVNTTTGKAIYLNYTINAGETAVLTFEPSNITFVSDFQGNILSTVLPGSNLAEFALQPGANAISFFSGGSTVTAVLDWPVRYQGVDDALYQLAP